MKNRNWSLLPTLERIGTYFVALLTLGCGTSSGEPHGHAHHAGHHHFTYAGSYPIHVVCTTGMVADLVRNVGGRHVAVNQMMGAGVDPHLYKASPGDVRTLAASDAVFYSGRHLEGKMGEVLDRLKDRKLTVGVCDAIADSKLLKTQDGTFDPHLWFDVSLWSEAAGVVRDALCDYDPSNAEEYRTKTQEYQTELAALHQYARQQVATIPPDQRVLVTAHDAFSYFGRAYDISVRGIQGWSTDTEAGVKEINELVDLITRRKIKAVFVETSVNDRNVRALVEGCQARGHAVQIGGSLFSDAMGESGTPEGAYVGMVRYNVDTIVKALR
jgi:manganese/zinc/iron transport system substrate-binding protein